MEFTAQLIVLIYLCIFNNGITAPVEFDPNSMKTSNLECFVKTTVIFLNILRFDKSI